MLDDREAKQHPNGAETQQTHVQVGLMVSDTQKWLLPEWGSSR